MKNELVSALLDGECTSLEVHSLLDQLDRSPELMRYWSRFNLVRDALAARPLKPAAQDDADIFCAGVMSQLGEMAFAPAVQAGAATANRVPNQTPHANVVSLPTRPREISRRHVRRSRPLVGWAAAASVTVLALAGGRAWIGSDAITGSGESSKNRAVTNLAAGNPAEGIQSNDVAGSSAAGLASVSTRSLTAGNGEPVEVRWGQLNPDAARELNSYMIEHNNSRAEQGMSGELAYARLATRNVGYEPADQSR